MNIAFFTNNYKPFVGGVPVAIDNLSRRLRQRGHRVCIFAPEYDGGGAEESDVIRCWSIKHFNATSFSLPLPITLEPYARFSELRIDVVHVHHPFLLGETGLHAARANDLPVVFTYHTQYEKYAHYLPFGERMVEEVAINLSTRFANCCDTIIAPSSDIRQTLLQRGVSVPIRVIPTGVDLQRFRRGSSRWLRAQFQIPQEDKVLLFVSRLAREKNVGFLIEVFARLAARKSGLWLVLVGSGDDAQALREQAQACGVGERVIFAGTYEGDKLVAAYHGADLFVFASTTETQGMVVLEAMAGGLPVVAVDAPGVRDVVVDAENGFLVAPGQAEEFVGRCQQLLDDANMRGSFIARARERARRFSLVRTTQKVEEVYRYVLRHPHPERNERFLLLREIFRYQFDRLAQGIEALLP